MKLLGAYLGAQLIQGLKFGAKIRALVRGYQLFLLATTKNDFFILQT